MLYLETVERVAGREDMERMQDQGDMARGRGRRGAMVATFLAAAAADRWGRKGRWDRKGQGGQRDQGGRKARKDQRDQGGRKDRKGRWDR